MCPTMQCTKEMKELLTTSQVNVIVELEEHLSKQSIASLEKQFDFVC